MIVYSDLLNLSLLCLITWNTHINANTIGTVDLELVLNIKSHKAAVHMHTVINTL
jgi:hypothetical protein